ncbi:cathepsin O-like [Schistocerca americana]|uniref:cathepsin O-like n=1 Tax=Schistocerca americana TaxID=7009 RepID=UPI001F4FB119|nr:cathepsin O-like [Schistocerca americana]XP_049937801.1 cathepsin O-like [Schistocerca serialis cubense]
MAVEWKTVFMTVAVVCLCFVGIPIRVDKPIDTATQALFKDYVKRFNKTYENNETEYALRLRQFQESLEMIQKLNSERKSEASAHYGLTKFSDMSPDEFLHHHLYVGLQSHLMKCNHWRNRTHHSHERKERAIKPVSLPERVDWREKNVIGKIRNQKTCGACWAFSTVETAEAMYALKTGVLEELSVQEMIDCAQNGNIGCAGGDTCSLLEWIVAKNISIALEKQYPLTLETQTCKLKGSGNGVHIAPNFTCDYLVGNEEEILLMLANHGPLIVAINALNWQNYLGGIIQFHCDGSPVHINHAVQIVGYDKSSAVPHYILRNSWGPEFGDKGYLYIAIGENLCGLATEVSSLDVL